MVNKEKNQEKDLKKDLSEEDKKALEEALETPLISGEIDRKASEKAKIQAEEIGKKLYLKCKIQDFDNDKLSKELYNYKATNSNAFNELVSKREKIIKSNEDISIAELEDFNNTFEMARISEAGFQKQKEEDEKRIASMKPSKYTEASCPKSIDEIRTNTEKYREFKYQGYSNLYKTEDYHKEFPDHEKDDLCSIHNDNCAEATITWQNEHRQASIRNKKFSKSVKILN